MTPPVSGGVPEQGLREPEGTLNRRLKRIADEMPALRDFIRAEHGPIGWEHTLSIWVTDLQKIVAALERPRPALPAPDWKDTARKVFDALCAAHHPTSCRKYADDSADCTCGRDAAFKAWEATAELQNEYDLENE